MNTAGDVTRTAPSPDPRSWLLLLLVANLAVFAVGRPASVLAASAIGVIVLVIARYRKAALIWALVATGAWFCWTIAPTLASKASLILASLSVISHVILMFGSVFSIAGAMLATMRISHFSAALARMRLPRFLVIPLTVTFRFVPVIRREYLAISDAMQMRGIQPGPAALMLHPLRSIEHILVPLISATLRAADDLSAAALTRGLGAPQRPTSVVNLAFRAVDAILLVLTILLATSIFLPEGFSYDF